MRLPLDERLSLALEEDCQTLLDETDIQHVVQAVLPVAFRYGARDMLPPRTEEAPAAPVSPGMAYTQGTLDAFNEIHGYVMGLLTNTVGEARTALTDVMRHVETRREATRQCIDEAQ